MSGKNTFIRNKHYSEYSVPNIPTARLLEFIILNNIVKNIIILITISKNRKLFTDTNNQKCLHRNNYRKQNMQQIIFPTRIERIINASRNDVTGL